MQKLVQVEKSTKAPQIWALSSIWHIVPEIELKPPESITKAACEDPLLTYPFNKSKTQHKPETFLPSAWEGKNQSGCKCSAAAKIPAIHPSPCPRLLFLYGFRRGSEEALKYQRSQIKVLPAKKTKFRSTNEAKHKKKPVFIGVSELIPNRQRSETGVKASVYKGLRPVSVAKRPDIPLSTGAYHIFNYSASHF